MRSLNGEHLVEAQRSAALAEANRIRTRRGKLKRHLALGNIPLEEVLQRNKDFTRTMRIGDLLLATPHVGKAKAERVLRYMGLSWNVRLEAITMRQRYELLAKLAEHYPSAVKGAGK